MMNRKAKRAGVTLGVALALVAMATGCGKKEVKVESSIEESISESIEDSVESSVDEEKGTYDGEVTVDLSAYREMQDAGDGTVWRYGEILDVKEDWVYLVATHEGALEVRFAVNERLEAEEEDLAEEENLAEEEDLVIGENEAREENKTRGIDLELVEGLDIGSCIKFRTPERVTNDLIETVYELEIVEAPDIFGVINPSNDSWRENEERIALCMPETVMEGEEVQHYGYVAFIEDSKLGVITSTGVKMIEASGFSVKDLIQFKSDGIEMRNIPADIPNTWDVELMDGEVYEVTKAKLDEALGQVESLEAMDKESLESVDEENEQVESLEVMKEENLADVDEESLEDMDKESEDKLKSSIPNVSLMAPDEEIGDTAAELEAE